MNEKEKEMLRDRLVAAERAKPLSPLPLGELVGFPTNEEAVSIDLHTQEALGYELIGTMEPVYGKHVVAWQDRRRSVWKGKFLAPAADTVFLRPSVERPSDAATGKKGAISGIAGRFEIVDRATRHALWLVQVRESFYWPAVAAFGAFLEVDLFAWWQTLPGPEQRAVLEKFVMTVLQSLRLSRPIIGVGDASTLSDLSELGQVLAAVEVAEVSSDVQECVQALHRFTVTPAKQAWTYRQNLADRVVTMGTRILSEAKAVDTDAVRERGEYVFAEALSSVMKVRVRGRWFPRASGQRF